MLFVSGSVGVTYWRKERDVKILYSVYTAMKRKHVHLRRIFVLSGENITFEWINNGETLEQAVERFCNNVVSTGKWAVSIQRCEDEVHKVAEQEQRKDNS